MSGRFELMILTLATAGLLLAPTATLRAQDTNGVGQRFRVLIPPFEPKQGADDDFGKDAAKKLRDLINSLATHQPVQEKEMKDEAKRFKLKVDELDCIRTRQLASQIDAQVALCADYRDTGEKQELVNATFYDVSSGESFEVQPMAFSEKQPDSAAAYVFHAFDTYVQQVSSARYCDLYAQSKDFVSAMEKCDKSIELNPNAIGSRYTRANILFEQEKYDEAMQELQRILKRNPNHQDALQLAGYISAKQGHDEEARTYYGKYLSLNPSDVHVRMTIAYRLAQAGDPVGAMQLIQVGLDVDPDNADLLEQYAGFAFNAALQADTGTANPDTAASSAVKYYREAIQAGEKVFAAKRDETSVVLLRNSVAAHLKLEEVDEALTLARQAIEVYPGEDQIWSVYANALHENGQLDEATAALDSAKRINPSDANTSLRQGSWLIQAGRVSDAADVLRTVAAGSPENADRAAQLLFGDAITNGVKKEQWDYAIQRVAAAAELPNLNPARQRQLTFWHAYSVYQQAVAEQKPSTVATAKATLPKFQKVLELLKGVGDYPSSVSVDLDQMTNACTQYVQIQEAIIKRGR